MKQQFLHRVDRRLLGGSAIVAFSIFMLLPVYPFLSTWLGTSIGPLLVWKSFKDVTILMLAFMLLIWLLSRPAYLLRLWWLWPLRLMVSFVLLAVTITWLRADTSSMAIGAGVLFGLRYAALFAVMVLIGYALRLVDKWQHRSLIWLTVAGGILGGIGLLQVTLLPADFLTHFGYDKLTTIAPVSFIDDNPDARRAFATLRGPNDYGAFLLLPLMAALLLSIRLRYRLVATGSIILGLLVSGSRSAWLGAGVMLLIYGALRHGKQLRDSRRLLPGLVIVIVVSTIVLWLATTMPQLRLIVFHSSPSDTHLTEGSTDTHWQATASGIKRVMSDPVGCGLGCAGPASFYSNEPRIAENYYVQIAEESGVVGLVLWLSWFGLVMFGLWRAIPGNRLALALFVSGAGLSIIGFWLHVWADDSVSLVWWGLAGMVLGNRLHSRYDRNKHETKTSQEPHRRADRIHQAAARR